MKLRSHYSAHTDETYFYPINKEEKFSESEFKESYGFLYEKFGERVQSGHEYSIWITGSVTL